MRTVLVAVVVTLSGCNLVFGLDADQPGLDSLAPSRGALTPPFAPDHLDYRVELSPLVSAVTLVAKAADDVTITIDGVATPNGEASASLALAPDQPRTVTVTARRDDRETTYTVELVRGAVDPVPVEVRPPTAVAGALFGFAMAIDGDRLAIGAPFEYLGQPAVECDGNVNTPFDSNRGAVYLYTRDGDGWAFETRLASPPTTSCGTFGAAVALAGDLLAVGSPFEERANGFYLSGTVFVYRRGATDWEPVRTLAPPAPQFQGYFGAALALDGQRLVVGAPGTNQGAAIAAGAVYVYSSDDDFAVPVPVVRVEPVEVDGFGQAVALDGDGLVATVPGDDEVVADSGAVAVVDAAFGVSELKVASPMASDYAGDAVLVHRGVLLLGAAYSVGRAGTLFTFRKQSEAWIPDQALTRTGGVANDYQGRWIAGLGDLIVTNACLAPTDAVWSAGPPPTSPDRHGAALVYRDDGATLSLLGTLGAPAPAADAMFGCGLAAAGDDLVVGAMGTTVDGELQAGTVYVFR